MGDGRCGHPPASCRSGKAPTTSGKGGKLRAISAAPTSKMIHLRPADLQPSKKKNGWVVARILATLKRLETQRVDKTDNQQAHVFVNEEVAKKKREKKSQLPSG